MITDPLTKEKFTPQRSNQKFANRNNQIKWNNLKYAEKNKYKVEIDRILTNNRKVLMEMLESRNENLILKENLINNGFKFGYYTHVKTIDGVNWAFVYEYGLLTDDEMNFKKKKHG